MFQGRKEPEGSIRLRRKGNSAKVITYGKVGTEAIVKYLMTINDKPELEGVDLTMVDEILSRLSNHWSYIDRYFRTGGMVTTLGSARFFQDFKPGSSTPLGIHGYLRIQAGDFFHQRGEEVPSQFGQTSVLFIAAPGLGDRLQTKKMSKSIGAATTNLVLANDDAGDFIEGVIKSFASRLRTSFNKEPQVPGLITPGSATIQRLYDIAPVSPTP